MSLELYIKQYYHDEMFMRKWRVARVTKTMLITEPINEVGAVLRFRRPTGKITNGMRIYEVVHQSFSVMFYYLEIKKEIK